MDDGRNRAARFSKAVGLRKVAMACHEEPLQIAKRSVLVSELGSDIYLDSGFARKGANTADISIFFHHDACFGDLRISSTLKTHLCTTEVLTHLRKVDFDEVQHLRSTFSLDAPTHPRLDNRTS